MSSHDERFRCMGTTMRLVLEGPAAADAAASARRYLEDFDRRLSRFRPDSELSRLNADPREEVPASALLRSVVAAGLWAAERTGGLLDPTLVDALEAIGYARSRADAQGVALERALLLAPERRPAAPDASARWRAIAVDDGRGLVRRPVGVRLDSGGVGKGLAADAVAASLAGCERFVVDCGGDLRVGGPAAAARPFDIEVAHPLTARCAHVLRIAQGAVATSGIDRRAWVLPDGRCHHHLIDPSTGRPAWTGLVGATAMAPTALEADALAKAAILSGPVPARTLLRAHGGILFHDDGSVERVAVPVPRDAIRSFMRPAA